uniref:Uncharacterized protein n=1 Tax=Candidatus Kentrum sp. LPFa TaxID=2126335 RepID=A0A450WW65_9GAMM|nr:MAG: hypothetical protein BECKLPF1236A_GA0070988_102924 [Candidatus Kentron sp. LPFa]VFK23601.1 MAG: hypothetical protein BECKLPF1236C_GA0070990_1000634 [Candidatus Kentron sp. LPFa]
MSMEDNNINPIQQGENAARNLLARCFGRWCGGRLLVIMVTVSILMVWILDISGYTLKAWRYLSALFTESTSVLTGDELEVANEWVIHVDSGATFSQVDAHRNRLTGVAWLEGEPWRHFTRNLRIARDPNVNGNWFLVADINLGVGTREEVTKTIGCVKNKVRNWAESDIFGSAIEHAYAFQYRISDFTKTYGRPKNLKSVQYPEESVPNAPEPNSALPCPHPYN